MAKRIVMLALLLATLVVGLPGRAVAAADDCATFAETGQAVCGTFLAYWRSHGGLAQQGFPLSGVFNERSTINNQFYLVQYFERAVMELHPNEPIASRVLLSQLGREALQARYPKGVPTATLPGAANPLPGGDTCDEFAITGQRVCGLFRSYWQGNGGLPQQGYPLTGVFAEKSAVDGQTYQVQYFERAVFEYHPELPIGQQVLLSQLGRLRYVAKYPNGPTVIESPYLAAEQITFKANGTFLEWTIPITNVSTQVLIAVTVTVVFYDATGQVIDSSLAAAINIEPGETRTLKGLSIRGLNFARYRILPPDVTVRSGG